MRRAKIIISILILIIIILISVVVVGYEDGKKITPPYTIGSPVLAATEMPPGMTLKTFVVSASEPTPTVDFDMTQDSLGGFIVHVTTTNFTFDPEDLGGQPIAGFGHVHLYIDNNLIIMLGPWYRIDSLSPGEHTIRVGLFNNDHSAYSVNGAQIEAQKQITVSGMSMKMAGM